MLQKDTEDRYTATELLQHAWLSVSSPSPSSSSPNLSFMVQVFQNVFVKFSSFTCRAQWLRGRASDSRLREPGFESCAAVLKPWTIFFTLYCSSSLSCINEYLAIDSGDYVYEQPFAHWL